MTNRLRSIGGNIHPEAGFSIFYPNPSFSSFPSASRPANTIISQTRLNLSLSSFQTTHNGSGRMQVLTVRHMSQFAKRSWCINAGTASSAPHCSFRMPIHICLLTPLYLCVSLRVSNSALSNCTKSSLVCQQKDCWMGKWTLEKRRENSLGTSLTVKRLRVHKRRVSVLKGRLDEKRKQLYGTFFHPSSKFLSVAAFKQPINGFSFRQQQMEMAKPTKWSTHSYKRLARSSWDKKNRM